MATALLIDDETVLVNTKGTLDTVPLDDLPEALRGYDCVLIATHHAWYDWQSVADNATLVVDTRNAMRDVTGGLQLPPGFKMPF